MIARIYKPSKTAMQSGKARTTRWRLEFEASAAKRTDPLMGWTSTDETAPGQVSLTFESIEDAVAYADKHKLLYSVEEEPKSTAQAKAYSDNFSFRRRKPWTH